MKCVQFAVNVCKCEMLIVTWTEHTSTTWPVNEGQDCDYQHQDKGTDQIWSFRDDMWIIESQKAMKCVHLTVYVCKCEMLILTCTEHTSTTWPVNEAQDYGYQHQDKGTNLIWNFRDDVCRIESQKSMKYYTLEIHRENCMHLF